ncbi:uncharacterized protein ASPGLDRAFT_50310 [Aspergillus glaucus CBS 516.65]|uniref:Uncharacterized protein n=1 Tax=Aspergillus glaucus CBS 516.65 TaxID=1160497 RepID=A0A1L9VBI6_ASPGL|nr:hypothetical protein ASPGLDRAFT_50310 [Aspergillus glaucus CBS 516.65]OJJ81260.1 hypothetical protein ASPGLDRAFT_50310 [Aspergillus glaucus CBS 516.65]
MLRQKWHDLIRIEDGSICESSGQYFGGPFFDQDGIRSTLYRTELRPQPGVNRSSHQL